MRPLEQPPHDPGAARPVFSLHGLRLRRVWHLWFLVIAVVVLRGIILPTKNTCFPCYRNGGLNWVHGNDLYQSLAATCRYSPLVHCIFAPFSLLPPTAGAAMWRLVESIALLGALAWWLRSNCLPSLTESQRATVLLITVPLMMGNLYSGQSNALVMAAILTCWTAVVKSRWTVAAIALTLACYFKIYPLALAMLLIAIYPRQFSWRMALTLIAGALIPFLLENPSYVARQYGRWIDNLVGDNRSDWPLVNGYCDGWMLVRAVGMPIHFIAYQVFTVLMGTLIGLLVVYLSRRGDGGREFVNRVFGLGCCWMTVFGPATEGHTYIYLSTTLAWLTVEAARGALPPWARRPIYWTIGAFLFAVVEQTTPLIHVVPSLWMPLAALVLFCTLVRLAICCPASCEGRVPQPCVEYRPAIQAMESAA